MANTVASTKNGADHICDPLSEAEAIPVNNLDELSTQLTPIADSERKEVRSLLTRNPDEYTTDADEVGPIGRQPSCILPTLLGEVNRLLKEIIKDEVMKLSKLLWLSSIAYIITRLEKRGRRAQQNVSCLPSIQWLDTSKADSETVHSENKSSSANLVRDNEGS
ncbi:unnamed protein product [Taenia asiatica]|uniref:Reverse transcriptase n=1 Tax=Taenia asiatica TaxID=60517 RepID=A0A0R3W4Y4_TAEAS|nr:unnamed protein product [Taenia asiatica]